MSTGVTGLCASKGFHSREGEMMIPGVSERSLQWLYQIVEIPNTSLPLEEALLIVDAYFLCSALAAYLNIHFIIWRRYIHVCVCVHACINAHLTLDVNKRRYMWLDNPQYLCTRWCAWSKSCITKSAHLLKISFSLLCFITSSFHLTSHTWLWLFPGLTQMDPLRGATRTTLLNLCLCALALECNWRILRCSTEPGRRVGEKAVTDKCLRLISAYSEAPLSPTSHKMLKSYLLPTCRYAEHQGSGTLLLVQDGIILVKSCQPLYDVNTSDSTSVRQLLKMNHRQVGISSRDKNQRGSTGSESGKTSCSGRAPGWWRQLYSFSCWGKPVVGTATPEYVHYPKNQL